MKNAIPAFCRAAAVCALFPLTSFAGGPTGGVVVGGSANGTISGQGTSVTTINQAANQAIINWQDFSIGQGDTVKFIQPSATAIALNRVLSGNPTEIYGSLQANGRVIVINPNGIMVGPGGQVDTKGFVASTLDVPDASFLTGGPMLFSGASTAAIKNQGTIQALGGDVFLIAHTVDNSGDIYAPQGTVGLAAGSAVQLVPSGNERISVLAGNPSSPAAVGVNNSGNIAAASAELKTAGGNIYALAINNGGVVRATGIVQQNGHIYLRAGGGNIQNSGTLAAQNADGSGGTIVVDGGHNASAPATVISSGTIDASGSAAGVRGGTVEILGDNVGLFDNALVDVSGDAGGGTALIGGDLHGANSAIQNAEHTYVGLGAVIKADALSQGNGGEIVIWSDGVTRDFGLLSALGGSAGGNGGFAEVSSKGVVDFDGAANLMAPAGKGGTLLFDPINITISTGANNNTSGFNPGTDNTEAFADDNVSSSTFQLTGNPATSSFGGVGNGATILLQAQINITVANAFNLATETGNNNVSLSLQAGNNININAAVTANGTGTLTLSANDNGGGTASGTGSVNFGASGSLVTAGQTVSISGQNITVGGLGINTTGSANNAGGNVNLNAGGTLALNAPILAEGGAASAAGAAGGTVTLGGATITTGAGGSINTSGSAATVGFGGAGGNITFNSTGTISAGGLTANGGAGAGFAGGSGGTIHLNAGTGITLNNDLMAIGGNGTSIGNAGPISLNTTSGGVTQSAGSLESGGLLLLGAGAFNITDSGNAVGTIAANVSGSVTYQDANALNIGNVLGQNGIVSGGNAINVSTVNGALSVGTTVDAGASTVTLAAGSSGNDNLLTISPAVTVHGGGGVTLAADNMTISSAANIVAGAATAILRPFENGTLINVGGANGASTLGLSAAELSTVIAGTLQIGNANSGALTVTAAIAPAVTLSLQSGSTISQNAGAIITDGTLVVQSGGAINLPEANHVGVLSLIGAGGPVQFTDAQNLDLQGIIAPAQTVTLTASGSDTLGESTGIINVNQLNLNNWGATTLNQANLAGILKVTGANGTFQYTSAANLDVQGIADSGQTVTLTGSGVHTVGESTGIIVANELDLDALGATTLNQANQVGILKATGAAGALQFTDAANLDVQGISGSGQTVTLSASGSHTLGESAGVINVNRLNLNNWGATTLNQANLVNTFQATGALGALQFTDSQNLDVLGIGATGQTVTLTAGGIAVLSETAGTINASQLNLANWGATALNQANQVGALSVTGPPGPLQFTDAADLTVLGIADPGQIVTLTGSGGPTLGESGVITASQLNLNNWGAATLNQLNAVGALTASGATGALQFTDAQNLDLQGISAPAQTVTLTASGSDTLGESAGTINVGQLSLNNWGATTLNQANQVGVLKAAGATAALQYTGAANLDVQGISDPGQTVTLTGIGGHTLGESTGTISAGELDINTWGATTLNQGNTVGILKVAGAAGALQFTDAGNLDVEGIAAGGQAVTIAATGDNNLLTVGSTANITGSSVTLAGDRINLAGTVTTPGVAWLHASTAGRQITVGTDDVSAPTVSGGTLGLTIAEMNNVGASTLRIGDANSGNLIVTLPIAPITFGTLSLQSGAVVTEASGTSITINNLAVQGASGISLGTANQVGTLAANSGGSIQFNNLNALSIGSADGLNGLTANNNSINISTINGPLTVNNTPAGADINAGSGTVNLTAGPAGSLLTIAAGAAVNATGGIVFTADDMTISGPVNSGGANTILQPLSAGHISNLGPSPIAGDLNLSQAELNEVTANVLQIGNNASGPPVGVGLVTAPITVHQLLIIGGSTSVTILSQQLAALSAVEIPAPKLDVAQFSSAALSLDEASKILPAGAIGTIWLQLPFPHHPKRTYKAEEVSKWTSGRVAAVGATAGPQTPK